MIENYKMQFEGHTATVVLDHATAVDIMAMAGVKPYIPEGCNTMHHRFRDSNANACAAINQRGFAPEQADNEQQVNGCMVIIVEHSANMPNAAAEQLLDNLIKTLMEA